MRMITRRIAFYLVTAVVAITVNFFIPRLMPGNPALAVLGRVQAQESKQAIAALELQYGMRPRPACGASTCSTGATCCTGTWAPR